MISVPHTDYLPRKGENCTMSTVYQKVSRMMDHFVLCPVSVQHGQIVSAFLFCISSVAISGSAKYMGI